ncbi:unnamed protein product [Lupinus luteus]|uniref:RNase H type-1 domain-containing protein n=1 Tax=Lupinus luteus TaxID=3873 RepID=A0AAV1XMN2_LUPLU
MDESHMSENQHIGFGGVIRDEANIWLSGFSKFLGKGLVLLSALLGMYGLLLAWEEGYRNIMCHSDSLMDVSLLSSVQDALSVKATPSMEEAK